MGLITPSCKKQVITETSTIETETGDRADAGQPQDGSVTVMDWPCSQNASLSNCKGGSLLDARWKKEERKAKGDMEKDSGQRDEGKGLAVQVL